MGLMKIASKNVITVTSDSSVQDAAKAMRENHVGDVVVVKAGEKTPIGILTDRDIVVSTVAFGVDASGVSVEDVMMPTLVTAKQADNVYHVLNLMKEHGVKRLPLVNTAGHVAGIVSSEDILAMLAAEINDVIGIRETRRRNEIERRRKLA